MGVITQYYLLFHSLFWNAVLRRLFRGGNLLPGLLTNLCRGAAARFLLFLYAQLFFAWPHISTRAFFKIFFVI